MGASRKLQGEIDRVLKKVQEGVDVFDGIWNKVYDTDNANQKEKFEADLKKEIKKLQRYRDQIKAWIQSSEIKDKKVSASYEQALMDARKQIEREMERFKICEKETKTKAFSKEGLGQQPKTDPKEKAKSETRDWLNNVVGELESQVDNFEAEIEGLSVKKGKARPPRLSHLEKSIARHKAHIMKLELILRLLDNDELSPEQVNDVKDFIDDYVERNQDDFDDFDEVDELYSSLPLEKVESLEDLVTIGPPGLVKGVGASGAVISLKASPVVLPTQMLDGSPQDQVEEAASQDCSSDTVARTPPSKNADAPSMSLTSAGSLATPATVNASSHNFSGPLTSSAILPGSVSARAVLETAEASISSSSTPFFNSAKDEEIANLPVRRPSPALSDGGVARGIGRGSLPDQSETETSPIGSGSVIANSLTLGAIPSASDVAKRNILGPDERLGSSGMIQPLVSPLSSRMILPQVAKSGEGACPADSTTVGGVAGMSGRVFSPSIVSGMQWRPGSSLQNQNEVGQFRGRTEIAPDQREFFLQRLQQVQQQGHSTLLGGTPLGGSNHKQFSMQQQNPLLQQLTSPSSPASTQAGLGLGAPASSLISASIQQNPISIQQNSSQQGALLMGQKDADPGSTIVSVKEQPRVPKRRKVVRPVSDPNADDNMNCPSRKHGIGKGLMTLWRVTNPGGGNFPPGVDFLDKGTMSVSHISTSKSQKTPSRNKRSQQRTPVMRRLVNNHKNKYSSSVNRRKVKCIKEANRTKVCNDKCELALVVAEFEEHIVQCSGLVDDEELELRELQAGGPNPLSCSAHFATDGWHCRSLCKDLLAKFPPGAVNMKQPFPIQPWDSSPKLVKKLFKVFHFLYTYAVTIDIFPFTLDEFAEAFHEKDSLLLGKIHVSLLKFLFSGVEMELSRGCTSRVSKNFLFLRLLHSVEHQESIVKLWKEFLNPLTWSEILHQVLVAAGFGSKEDILRRKYMNKEVDMMAKYGLRPGTLKYVLFNILSEQGTNGMKVSDLANSLQMMDFNLHGATKEVDMLISSTLASDVTLFEKISFSAYRLRINSGTEGENFQSDNEDSGSVDDDTRKIDECSCDSDCDSLIANASKEKQASHCQIVNSLSIVHTETEIDESNPEEAWLLGLMEGGYSNLCIEEKLDALVALVDLLDSASSIPMEDAVNTLAEYAPNVHVGSGAKVKRSPPKEHDFLTTSWVAQREEAPLEPLPVDSLALMLNPGLREKYVCEVDDNDLEVGFHLHPMQSIFLGSDRRYNRYWLFLGPCNSDDLGHKRIYFESSEDGHWEVIDSEVALCSLLSTLDCRGRREAFLLASLEKRQNALCQAMSSQTAVNAGNNQLTRSDQTEIVIVGEDGSSPVSGVDNNICLTEVANDPLVLSGAKVVDQTVKKREEEKQKWGNLQAFDAWVWDSFYCNLNAVKHRRTYFDPLMRCESCHDLFWRDEKHCKTCHLTFELDFDLEERYTIHAAMCRERENVSTFPKHKVLPSQLQSLKAAMHAIESFMPNDALVGAWSKSAHNLWIKRLRRTSSLVELLQVISDFVGAVREEWLCESKSSLEEIVANFWTLLPTSSAVALWLVKLDALIARLVTLGRRSMSTVSVGRRVSWKA